MKIPEFKKFFFYFLLISDLKFFKARLNISPAYLDQKLVQQHEPLILLTVGLPIENIDFPSIAIAIAI